MCFSTCVDGLTSDTWINCSGYRRTDYLSSHYGPRSRPLLCSTALALLCISGVSVPRGLTSCLQVPWSGEALVRIKGQASGGLGMSQCQTQLRLGFYLRQRLCPWHGSVYHNPPWSWLLGGSADPVLTDDQGTSLLLGPHSHTRGNRLLLLGSFS